MSSVFHTYPEAAQILRQPSDWWLRRNISRLPHRKIGRTVVFADEDLLAIGDLCRVGPASSARWLEAAPVTAVSGLVPSKARRRRTA